MGNAKVVRNSTSQASAGVSVLYERLEELRALTYEMSSNPPPYKMDDHFAFMSLLFLSRQNEHANAILALVKYGLHRDGLLVVRSMIEGLAQLLWATQDAQTLALRWRAFVFVGDLRTMKAKIEMGEKADPGEQLKIEEGLRRYGHLFRTKRRRNGAGDDYCMNWTGQSYSKVLEDRAQDGRFLRLLYSPLSAWHHWSPDGIGQGIRRDGEAITFLAPSSEDAWTALATGFQCLFQTAQVTDIHLKLGFEKRLADLRELYLDSGGKHMNPKVARI